MLVLGGCAVVGETSAPPKFITPPAVSATLAEAGEASVRFVRHWPRAEWWKDFHDPELNRLLDAALRGNPDLRVALARLRQAEAAAEFQAADLLPALDSEFEVRQRRFSATDIYGPLGGRTRTGAYLDAVVLRYRLDLWGKQRAALEAAAGLEQAQRAELALARLLLATALARAYFRLGAAEGQARLAGERVARAEERCRLAQLRWERGLDTRDAVEAATQQLAEARQLEAELHAETQKLRHRIAALAGQGPDWGRTVTVAENHYGQAFPLPERLPLTLLAHRPDVVAARWRAEAAARAVHIAKAEFYPDLELTGFAGLRSVDLKALFLSQGASLAYAIGPTLSLPLFDGGRRRAELKKQEAGYAAAVESYNRTVLEAVRQVAEALAEWQRSQREDRAQEQAVAAAAAQWDLAVRRARAGLATRLDALRAEQDLLQQRIRLTALQGEHWVHAVDLIEALGGGYAAGSGARDNP
ncbi:Outer membrane component of tripartite multidrug resistance system [Candidatus Methylocalor cossyra]|uniref:Outer membrane component of tripartite multidrug resistance system n=1 Tax=Candidatus Methylocalor cossyra TaxID=3108543 RepID=A0ABM9NLZ2_9GAMM